MRRPLICNAFLLAGAACVSACGGGGGSRTASTPPPPTPTPTPTPTPSPTPTPTPTPAHAILSGATTSQEFASKGASYVGGNRASPHLADGEQLKLRYDAAFNRYEIQLPASSAWLPISPTPDAAWTTADSAIVLSASQGSYTSLIRWSGNGQFGVTAVAIPTPGGAVPTVGSADYAGSISGWSSETVPFSSGSDIRAPGAIGGTISLSFDFATGGLSGGIQPRLLQPRGFGWTLPSLNFTETIHAVGGTTFSGKFSTNLSGLNSFSGLFAGPTASDVAGNFALPYQSPLNGSAQQASGAFTARRSP